MLLIFLSGWRSWVFHLLPDQRWLLVSYIRVFVSSLCYPTLLWDLKKVRSVLNFSSPSSLLILACVGSSCIFVFCGLWELCPPPWGSWGVLRSCSCSSWPWLMLMLPCGTACQLLWNQTGCTWINPFWVSVYFSDYFFQNLLPLFRFWPQVGLIFASNCMIFLN